VDNFSADMLQVNWRRTCSSEW